MAARRRDSALPCSPRPLIFRASAALQVTYESSPCYPRRTSTWASNPAPILNLQGPIISLTESPFLLTEGSGQNIASAVCPQAPSLGRRLKRCRTLNSPKNSIISIPLRLLASPGVPYVVGRVAGPQAAFEQEFSSWNLHSRQASLGFEIGPSNCTDIVPRAAPIKRHSDASTSEPPINRGQRTWGQACQHLDVYIGCGPRCWWIMR
jgi:hypothetical protein